MNPHDVLAVTGGLAAGAGAAFVAYRAVRARPSASQPVATAPVEADATKLQRFVHPPAGVHPRFRPYAERPPTAHEVHIVEMRRPAGLSALAMQSTHSGAATLALLEFLKSVMRQANRSDEDARIVLRIWEHETSSGRNCWGNNWTNVKSTGSTFATPEMVLNERRLFCSVPEVNGVWLANGSQEIPGKVDGYLAFPDSAAFARYEYRLLHSPRYRGVLEGHRRGGLEGGIAAERELGTTSARPGWSYASPDEREAQFREYWAEKRRLVGAAAWDGAR